MLAAKARRFSLRVGVVLGEDVALDADDALLAQARDMRAGDPLAVIDHAVLVMMMIVVVVVLMIVGMIMVVRVVVRAVRVRVGLVLIEGDRRFAASAYAAHQSISISRIFNSSPAVICTR